MDTALVHHKLSMPTLCDVVGLYSGPGDSKSFYRIMAVKNTRIKFKHEWPLVFYTKANFSYIRYTYLYSVSDLKW